MNNFGIILFSVGFITLFTGAFVVSISKKSEIKFIEWLDKVANNIFFGRLFGFFLTDSINKRYQKLIKTADINLKVKTLMLIKIICGLSLLIVVISMSFTNYYLVKYNDNFIQTGFAYNDKTFNNQESTIWKSELFKGYLKFVEKENYFGVDKDSLTEIFWKYISIENIDIDVNKFSDEKLSNIANEFSNQIVLIYTRYRIDPITIFWFLCGLLIPEVLLIGRKLVLGGKFKQEVIMLENIFELLAGIKGIKTIEILNELAKHGKVYKNILKKCRDSFVENRELALEELKENTRNKRLAGLSDSIRIFSFSDRDIALQMIERQRMEHEEGVLITLEEDMDIIDIIAFLCVIPIVYQLANMILMPMMETINQAFGFF